MLRKIPHPDCAGLLAAADLSAEGRALLDPSMPPKAALEALAGPETILDFLRFFAHAVPPREGVCWALAVLHDLCPTQDPAETAALDEARRWVRAPEETTRRRCLQAAGAIGTESPVGWLCLAVGWSGGGSIVPPDLPQVLPPAGLHAKALFGAVALCLPPELGARAAPAQRIVDLAQTVAEGGWPGLPPAGA